MAKFININEGSLGKIGCIVTYQMYSKSYCVHNKTYEQKVFIK